MAPRRRLDEDEEDVDRSEEYYRKSVSSFMKDRSRNEHIATLVKNKRGCLSSNGKSIRTALPCHEIPMAYSSIRYFRTIAKHDNPLAALEELTIKDGRS